MEIKIAILDDEKVYLDNIKRIVEENTFGDIIKVNGFLQSKQLLECQEEFDILLIDMELSVVNEGLDTVRLYKEQGRDAIVIFVTSHEEMVRDGYKVNAFEYVYKNNLDVELKSALGRAFEYLRKRKEIEVTIINKSKANIQVKDIIYLETCGRNVKLNLKRGEYIIADKIGDLYMSLKDYDFILPHKSFVVNLRYVSGFTLTKVLLKTADTIPLTRKYKKEAEERFWDYKIRNKR